MAELSITILIADGNADDRSSLAASLRADGYTVMQAVDGGSALKVINEHEVGVAVVNNEMTPYTGFDFARQVLLRGRPVGIILTTDAAPADLLVEAGRLGIGHVVKKPVDPGRLAQLIARLTGSP